MAKEEENEDLDLGAENGAGSKKKLIIIIAGVLLLLMISGGAAFFLLGGEEEVIEGDGQADVVQEQLPAIYHPLDPVFVVNLPPGGKARMLQIGVQVMARDPEVIAFVKNNDPMLRHNLLSLFSSQRDAALRDRKGKEKLQSEVFSTINKIIKDQKGPGEIEAIFFTSFVMQ
ncbi:MAG: flagellar basal body-associated FliL family protein [Sedimenticola sp.]|nr:flagellar basal body-associated FliL family protein [Sedimenticola sp.]MCW8921726.1 flagellar basal body-associated FliL family protein [Sedimenticola sp.]MCW8946811.1 flagellar basal body-associated FliL family protein [Sedimenticola sp.]MCW8948894.1 flagellar basal body-associated FliL family protein [Sedimenticola sp.]MCW8974270.1 flagellar basal body-associated FliL family protein [Sedimenticola sp.]